jgi:Uncharacterized protein conserved in bacteria (DUF2252)
MATASLRPLPAVALALLALGASPAPGASPLAVDPGDPRLLARPEVTKKLLSSAHAYFRFVNAAFANETCDAFADIRDQFPEVNLHGDAHVEQYTVTNLGRGVSDFDDCTRGKPMIDLVRFGTSLLLAAREKGWQKDERRFLDEFLKGYKDALKNPRRQIPMPDVATRVRRSFKWDRGPALQQARRLIEADPQPTLGFADTIGEFAGLIRFGRDDLPPDFFKIKEVGALRMGIGSALDEKYLIILEAWSDSDDDDIIVEAKQIRDLSGNPCVRTDVGASRILDGQRLIAYEPFAFSAVVPRGDKYFWVHDWTDDYQEASIASVIETERDLREIAYDAGIQLGRAHPKRPDGTPDEERQKATWKAVERYESRIRAVSYRMAEETEAAWKAFRDAAHRSPTD